MLIGIDANEANVHKRVGIGTFAYEILWQLAKIKKKNIKFLSFLKENPFKLLPEQSSCWQYKVFGPKLFWTQFALPFRLYKDYKRPNVFFTPGHYAPRFSPVPTVICIMDLSYIYFPEMFKKKDLWQLKSWTGYSVKKASKIITISKKTREDLLNYYSLPENKVEVVYPGFSIPKIQEADLRDVCKKYGIKKDYILFVGTLQPRKNLERLITAFASLIKDSNHIKAKTYKDLQLVVVGKKGWLYDSIFAKAKQLNLQKEVIFTDFVSDDELAVLYKHANFFILPSFYEGFGLPVIESFYYQTPVIVSATSSLPEIAGEGAIYIDPLSVKSIYQGMKKTLFLNVSEKKTLVKSGQIRLKYYQWDKSAQKVLDILIDVAKR